MERYRLSCLTILMLGVFSPISSPFAQEKRACVALYSAPLENLGAIGCSHINTTNRDIEVTINQIDQFGDIAGGTVDDLGPRASGNIVSRLTSDLIYACVWTYRGRMTDLRAAITNYQINEVEQDFVPVFGVTAPNLGVRVICP